MDQLHPVVPATALVRHLKLSVLPHIVAAPDRLASYGRFHGLTDPAKAVNVALERAPLSDIFAATEYLVESIQRPDDRLQCPDRRAFARLAYVIESRLTAATSRAQARVTAQRLITSHALLQNLLDDLSTHTERLRSRSALVRASVQAGEEFLQEPPTQPEAVTAASGSPLHARTALRLHLVDLKVSAKSHDDAIRSARQAQMNLRQVQANLGSALQLVPAWLEPLSSREPGDLERTKATILRRLRRSNTILAALLHHSTSEPGDPPPPGSAWRLSPHMPRRDPRTQMVLDEPSPWAPGTSDTLIPRVRRSLAVARFTRQALC